MRSSVRDIADRLSAVIQRWEELCPEQTFAEMTLDEFKLVAKPSLDARAKLISLDTQWQNTMAERKAADAAALPSLQRFVNAVKAHPKFGEDSGLYTSLGYVPKSQRGSGLTRRREKEDAKAADEVA